MIKRYNWEENGHNKSATQVGGAIIGDGVIEEVHSMIKQNLLKEKPYLLTIKELEQLNDKNEKATNRQGLCF